MIAKLQFSYAKFPNSTVLIRIGKMVMQKKKKRLVSFCFNSISSYLSLSVLRPIMILSCFTLV